MLTPEVRVTWRASNGEPVFEDVRVIGERGPEWRRQSMEIACEDVNDLAPVHAEIARVERLLGSEA